MIAETGAITFTTHLVDEVAERLRGSPASDARRDLRRPGRTRRATSTGTRPSTRSPRSRAGSRGTRTTATRSSNRSSTSRAGSRSPTPPSTTAARRSCPACTGRARSRHRYVDPLGFECLTRSRRRRRAPRRRPAASWCSLADAPPHRARTRPTRCARRTSSSTHRSGPRCCRARRGTVPQRGRVACDDPDRQFPVVRGGAPVESLVDLRAMQPSRALGAALEPVAGQVYFSPECHKAYEGLGFGASPAEMGGVAMPDGPAYFCSRGSSLGQVPGEVVAAAFAVFNPEVVVPAVDYGWSLTDAADDRRGAHRGRGRPARADPRRRTRRASTRARELLERAGERLRPEGRALFACLLDKPVPDSPVAAVWLLADRLREYRGDSHTAAVDRVRVRRHRDRPAQRAVLGLADAHLRADPGVERGSSSMPPRSDLRHGASSPTAGSPTPAGQRGSRSRS